MILRFRGFVLRNLPVLLIGLGTLLRLRAFFTDRTLWGDEAALALSILQTPFSGLLHPLQSGQVAPLGYLFVLKAVSVFWSPFEMPLRSFSLFLGLLSLPLFYHVARRLTHKTAAMAALALFSLSQPLIYYSSELKPYGPDLFFALAILAAALRLQKKPGRAGAALFFLTGLTAIAFSFPAVFVTAGCALSLLMLWRKNSPDAPRLLLTLLCLTLAALFMALKTGYLDTIRHTASLTRYWTADYPPLPVNGPALHFYFQWPFKFIHFPMGLDFTGLAFFILLCGALALYRSDRKRFVLLAGPAIVALMAALAHIYPLNGRVSLYLVPWGFLCLGCGLAEVAGLLRVKRPGLALLLVGVVLSDPAGSAIRKVVKPDLPDNVRPVLEHIQKQRLPNDKVYLYYGAVPAATYHECTRGPIARAVPGRAHREQLGLYDAEIERLFVEAEGPVWMVFTHVWGKDAINEEMYLVLQARKWAVQKTSFHVFAGSTGYLFLPRSPARAPWTPDKSLVLPGQISY